MFIRLLGCICCASALGSLTVHSKHGQWLSYAATATYLFRSSQRLFLANVKTEPNCRLVLDPVLYARCLYQDWSMFCSREDDAWQNWLAYIDEFLSRCSARIPGRCSPGRSCSRTRSRRRHTPGSASSSYVSQVLRLPSINLKLYVLCLYSWLTYNRVPFCGLTEEEANLLRLYVDQPGYVDLHWVCLSILYILIPQYLQCSQIWLFFTCVVLCAQASPTFALQIASQIDVESFATLGLPRSSLFQKKHTTLFNK